MIFALYLALVWLIKEMIYCRPEPALFTGPTGRKRHVRRTRADSQQKNKNDFFFYYRVKLYSVKGKREFWLTVTIICSDSYACNSSFPLLVQENAFHCMDI